MIGNSKEHKRSKRLKGYEYRMDTKDNMNGKIFKTYDCALAAYLYSVKRMKICGLNRIGERNRYEFIFEDEENRKNYVLSYYNSECKIFDEGMRNLKSMMRNW